MFLQLRVTYRTTQGCVLEQLTLHVHAFGYFIGEFVVKLDTGFAGNRVGSITLSESSGNFGVSVTADGKRMATCNLNTMLVCIRELPSGKLLHTLGVERFEGHSGFSRPIKVL
jgi:hypothetical protein